MLKREVLQDHSPSAARVLRQAKMRSSCMGSKWPAGAGTPTLSLEPASAGADCCANLLASMRPAAAPACIEPAQ